MKILAEPIDAIVKFKEGERPIPYKFRYSECKGIYHEIRVDRILVIEEIKLAGIRALRYLCQSEIDGNMKLYELKYLIADCRWELYKI